MGIFPYPKIATRSFGFGDVIYEDCLLMPIFAAVLLVPDLKRLCTAKPSSPHSLIDLLD